MKNFALSLLSVLMILGFVTPTYAQTPDEGKRKFNTYGVAFYNLENLFDTINNNGKYDLEFSPKGNNKWDGYKYWKKIRNMAYVISQMTTATTPKGPAVIGVSEIENITVLQDLVKDSSIKDWGLKIIHHDSPDARGVDVGLLYNPLFFKPIRTTNHRLVVPSLPNFKTRDQMCVVGLLGGKRVGIIVNHWPSRRGGGKSSSYLREAAADLSRSIADSLLKVDPDMGIIVMGDLNDDPMDKSVSENLGARLKAEETEKGGFFNPFWQLLNKGFGSYIYRSNWSLFDQIIVNSNLLDGNAGLTFHGAEVLNMEFLKQKDGAYKGHPQRTFSGGAWTGGYSDHFPTEIFLIKEVK